MAQYFEGREQLGSPFSLPTKSTREQVRCTVFKRWVDTNQGVTLRCGRNASIEISKTTGIDEKTSESVEASVESTLGVTGLAELKSKMKGILGHEIQWNRATTTRISLQRKAPRCGRYELAVRQLVREYEFDFYACGFFPFRKDTWQWKEKRTVPELTETYDVLEDDIEFDERCTKPGCGAPATAPNYEGRVCLDLGVVSLNLAYRSTNDGVVIRLGRQEHLITGLTLREVRRSGELTVPVEPLSDVARFLGEFSEDSVPATISFAERFDLPATLAGSAYAVYDFAELETEGLEDTV
ncbi:MAG: hypothetical protein ACK5AZ_15375 [Bryobacteraceae bacterium]